MKKVTSLIMLIGLSLGFTTYSVGECTRETTCGSQGSTLSCTGTSCTGSRPLTQNPWVECDAIRNYCYPQIP